MLLLSERLPEAKRFEDYLLARVVGQPEAVRAVVDAWEMWDAGMSPEDRPACTLMFIGPTGCGKTYLPLVSAEYLAGSQEALLRVDCGEYTHGHEVAKLTGAPPGYLGHRETKPLLAPENLRANHRKDTKLMFLLFDEIDKAGPDMVSLLLGLTGTGQLTLGDNRKVDLRDCMVFFTGNTGTQEAERSRRYGYTGCGGGSSRASVYLAALRKKFTPEFLNRMTRVVVFNDLTEADLEQIARLETERLMERYVRAGGDPSQVRIDESFYRQVVRNAVDWGGARAIRREIERCLLLPLARSLRLECRVRVATEGGRVSVVGEG